MSTISNEARIAIERRIARALIRHMKAAGWSVAAVFDGDRTSYPAGEGQAMDLIFNLDEASLRFIKSDKVHAFYGRRIARKGNERDDAGVVHDYERNDWGSKDEKMHGVLLVLGNGEDIISDWNYSDGDPDGFNAAMEAFDAYEVAAQE